MNIFGKLTLRQMKLNRRRTIVTILGIIISVAMITAVSSFSGSFMDMFRRLTISQSGNFHVAYSEITEEQYTACLLYTSSSTGRFPLCAAFIPNRREERNPSRW